MPLVRNAAASAGSSLVRLQVESIANGRVIWAFLDHCVHCSDINDLMADDAVSCELLSLLTGKLTGNFANFRGPIRVKPAPESFSKENKQIFLQSEQGRTGNHENFLGSPRKYVS